MALSRSKRQHLSKKIWIAISTPFQVNFFYPLIKKLEDRFDFIITARDHDRIFSLLEAKGLSYFPVGKHGGSELEGRLDAYAHNIEQLIPVVKRERPDLLLTERWPEAVRVAFGFNIPAWTIYYDERERYVNRMVFPLASKVFAPRFYKRRELSQNGVNLEKVVWFNGFHTCYLKDRKVGRKNPFLDIGIGPPIILVRPEPEFATFFDQKKKILEQTVHTLVNNEVRNDFNIVVLPRSEKQALRYSGYPVAVMKDAILENPVAYADVTVGAAETMLMEAFVLGKPAISMVYWEESKPVAELHRYIPHITDPKIAAVKALDYLDPDRQREFHQQAKFIVDLMENPVHKIVREINKLYAGPRTRAKESPGRRSRIEIYMEILHAVALRPLKLTHIMLNANLSYSKLRRDLDYLKKRDLIEERKDSAGGKLFRTTRSGLKLLHDWKEIEERIF